MSLAFSPLAAEWIYALGWTLLHFLWQGALVGAAYGVARIALAHSRPQARYALGLGALALLAVLPVATLAHLAPVAVAGDASLVAGTSVVVGSLAAVDAVAGTQIEPMLPWLVGAWLVGVMFCALRALLQYVRMRRLCRRGAEPLPEWDARLRELCRRFGVTRPVRLLRSAIVQTPSLFGWIAPVIVLPASVLVGLTPQQIELVIAHELGHVRRWDYAVNLLQIVVETVLFYHPVVHFISRDVRNEREACCDDLVLRRGADPVDYAKTLASLEELRGMTHAPALAASGGHLVGRIRRIVGVEPRFGAPAFGAQAVLVAALAFAAVMSVKPVARDVLNLAVSEPAATTEVAATPAELVTRAAALAVERALAPEATTATVPVAPVAAPPESAPVAADEAAALAPPKARLALALPAFAPPVATAPAAVSDLSFERAARLAAARPAVPARREAIAIETIQPEYPRRAALAGLEGQVVLSFFVDGAGRARNIKVASSSGAPEFAQSAVAALRRWRFSTDSIEPRVRFAQTFDFALGGGNADSCKMSVGSRICRRVGAEEE